MSGPLPPLLLVAHGSRDPRSGAVIERLAGRLAAARPGLPVLPSALEHRGVRPAAALARLARTHRSVVVLPLLLTAAYHGSVDVPAVLAAARTGLPGLEIRTGAVLGPDDRLLDALDECLAGRYPGRPARRPYDGLVLGVAGTRDAGAVRGIERVAARYGARHGVPCLPAFASAGGPTVPAAVDLLRTGAGTGRIAVVSYFLAPGLLHDRIVAGGRESGVDTVAAPFGATDAMVGLVLTRYDEARGRTRNVVRSDRNGTGAGFAWNQSSVRGGRGLLRALAG